MSWGLSKEQGADLQRQHLQWGPSTHFELMSLNQRKQTQQTGTWLVIVHQHHGCISLLQVQSLVYKAAVAALDYNCVPCSKQ